MQRNNNGFVLVQVLLIFALLSLLVANLLYNQQVSLERSARLADDYQLREWAYSGEQLNGARLRKAGLEQAVTEPEQAWEEEFGPFETFYQYDGDNVAAEITMNLTDLSGRFNLNWLSKQNENRDAFLPVLEQYLADSELDGSIARNIYDFMDDESFVENDYRNKVPPYLPSQQPLAHLSELLLIENIDLETLNKLAELVYVGAFDAPLNVMMADDALLQAWHPNMNEEIVGLVKQLAPENNFSSITENDLTRELEPPLNWQYFSSRSFYFQGLTLVNLEDRQIFLNSVYSRDMDSNVDIVYRAFNDDTLYKKTP